MGEESDTHTHTLTFQRRKGRKKEAKEQRSKGAKKQACPRTETRRACSCLLLKTGWKQRAASVHNTLAMVKALSAWQRADGLT